MAESPIERLAGLSPDDRVAAVAVMSDEEIEVLLGSWSGLWARPEQRAPEGDWRFWAIITGRAWGKNRAASEWVLDRCQMFAYAAAEHLVGLFGRTDEDVHRLQLGGVSGLVACCGRRGWRIHAPPSSQEAHIYVPLADGSEHVSVVEVHSGGDPDRCRGRNFNTVHADELCAWRHVTDAEGNTTFTNMNFGLRGVCPPPLRPQGIVTTTPKPIPIVKEMLAGKHGPTHVTQGTLLDNRSNLDPTFVKSILDAYEGTRLELQEIYGVVLDSVEGALWDQDLIHRWRLTDTGALPDLGHIVIGVDPSGSDGGDECGIVAVGKARELDGKARAHIYVLEDRSIRNRPSEWAPEIVNLHHSLAARHPDARLEIVFETNYGGQMGVDTLRVRDSSLVINQVTATRAKRVRAEPVAMLYDQGRAHHVGVFPELEESLCWWTPLEPTSPDRMDALVWAAIGLLPELVSAPAGYTPGFSDMLA